MKIEKILVLALLLGVIMASGCAEETVLEQRIITIIGQEMTMKEMKGMMSSPEIDENAYQTRTVEFLDFSYIFGNITRVERFSVESNYGLVTFADGEQKLLGKLSGWFSGLDDEWQENKIHRIRMDRCGFGNSKCIYSIITINEG